MSVGGAPPKQMRERERERRKWPNALLLALMCAALVYSCISYYREHFTSVWSPPEARTGTCPFGSLAESYSWEAGGRDRRQTFEECLVAHGKTLDSGYPTRWHDLASRSTGKQRMDYLARHTMAVWLWTLSRRHGTPCMPLIIRWQCTTQGHCGGIGDRIKGIQVGFWLAVATNSVFIMEWMRPVPLEEYFLPASDELYFDNYRTCLGDRKLRKMTYTPRVPREHNNNHTALNLSFRAAQTLDAKNAWRGYDVIDINNNAGYMPHYLQNKHFKDAMTRYGLEDNSIVDYLYISNKMYLGQPSKRMQALAKPILKELRGGGDTVPIGVHMRMGDSNIATTTAWSTHQNYPLGAVICWVRAAVQQCRLDSPRKCMVYLSSDSSQAIDMFRERLSHYGMKTIVAPGQAAHMDYIGETGDVNYADMVEALSKDYLDWYILTQVEVFVMSKSGFAFSAAYSTVPVRGVWMQRDVDACTWSNYNDHCLMRACPGQIPESSLYRDDWTLGKFEKDDAVA